MIYAGVPSFFGLGLEDGHVPTFWLLVYDMQKLSWTLSPGSMRDVLNWETQKSSSCRLGCVTLGQYKNTDTNKDMYLHIQIYIYIYTYICIYTFWA